MTLNNLKRITISNPTLVTSVGDIVAIDVKTPRKDSGCSLDKQFIGLIRMNL